MHMHAHLYIDVWELLQMGRRTTWGSLRINAIHFNLNTVGMFGSIGALWPREEIYVYYIRCDIIQQLKCGKMGKRWFIDRVLPFLVSDIDRRMTRYGQKDG